MICEIIRKKGEKGSGGTRDAFAPGVTYVCSKAARVVLRNLTSADWRVAAEEMGLSSELSSGVRKPYYHVVLSWHEHERPDAAQMFAAMEHMIRALGLEEHQAAIGNHDDTNRCHIHAVMNTVHPTSGKVWSKSQDHQKAELACRQIELDQGWTHERGRFDFDVVEKDGQAIVQLRPAWPTWEKKKRDRAAGERRPSPGDIAFRKHHGFESFSQDIPPALRDRFAQAVAQATDWETLHEALAPLGLHYRRHGSGARVCLVGSEEFARASAFGGAFSIGRMQKRLGPYRDHETDCMQYLRPTVKEIASATGTTSEKDAKALKAAPFRMTLLRRVYTALHRDERVARQIRYVDLDGRPPQVTFRDNSAIMDHGEKISASAVTEATIMATVAMAKAKGWAGVVPSGPPDYVRGIAIEAARSGLAVTGVPADIGILSDRIIREQAEAQKRRLEQEAGAALNDTPGASAGHEVAPSAEARAAAAAVFGDGLPQPPKAAPREPGSPVPRPQAAPDVAKRDDAGVRQIRHQIGTPEWHEIEDMKRADIGVIAALGGWSDVTGEAPGASDRDGERFRSFQRGDETITASLVDGEWLWASTTTGEGGSAIDLWLHDNPGKSLAEAWSAFREILGVPPSPASGPSGAPETRDHTDARRQWEQAVYSAPQRSYAENRGISRETLARFRDQVRAGAFGEIYFAHRNPETGDIQGFEQVLETGGRENTSTFAKGGRKTVNVLGDPGATKRMVVCEGGLEALALAELEARTDTIYVSTGGGFGSMTEDALRRLAEGKAVFSGFDNGAAGAAMHEELLALLPATRRLAPPLRLEGSERACKDWLDVLSAAKEAVAAKQASEPSEEVADQASGTTADASSPELPAEDTDSPGFSW